MLESDLPGATAVPGLVTSRPVRYLFSFIGAEPNTDWLAASGLKLDDAGSCSPATMSARIGLPLETSRRGVFAVGDVRSCSVKRVAASVGDGAQVVAAIHAYLAKAREQPDRQSRRSQLTVTA